MKLRNWLLLITTNYFLRLIESTQEISVVKNDTLSEFVTLSSSTTTLAISFEDKLKKYLKTAKIEINEMKSRNITTASNKTVIPPPSNLVLEYLRCRQMGSINGLPSPNSCPYEFQQDIRVCWKATGNGSIASALIEYDHGQNTFYDGARYGIANCTLERYCQSNGTWAMTVSPEIQCKSCDGIYRPIKFNSISIMIETFSLSLSLISLTIAVLCMINVKRLHLPRNLLHIHLFVAFIFRSIVKLIFIHLIVDGYTRSMITYTKDKCGQIEILAKSTNLFHIVGCRLLSSLFWYTDAVSQTFIFCEAMFLFTTLTSHLFRERSCLIFVLWGWLSPLLWLIMWIGSHIITDNLKQRSTCWLEADNTTYFYYFFYVPYAFYLLINFIIFLYLVRLIYSKYQSNTAKKNHTGNRHLIKSILILIPLFGLHSLLIIWVFYHKNQQHTIWYYITIIFKAVFGDLQGFFTSLIYFYFNTEIRYEVYRQVQRTILSKDNVRRSSTGETLSTRLSTFRRSINRHRHSSVPNRNDRRRTHNSMSNKSLKTFQREIWWKKLLGLICPCFNMKTTEIINSPQERPINKANNLNDLSPATVPELNVDDGHEAALSPTTVKICSVKCLIEIDGLTCDTVLIKHDNDYDDLLTDENEVTFQQSSHVEPTSLSSYHTPLPVRHFNLQRIRSNSEGLICYDSPTSSYFSDSKSLR